ncbi:Disintegrin-domain-containing protein, partial [Gonapodya prolifera JEL478]
TVSKFVCGNGIREGSEQCDCGGAASCANDPCCTSNCTLKAGALCSPKQDTCCTQTCQLLPKGRVCRNSTGHCDTPEFCDGNNPSCPTDVFLQNGTPC